jgi:transaldolase
MAIPDLGAPVHFDISNVRQLTLLGQSVWLDSLSRQMLHSGELQSLIDGDGVSGASLALGDVAGFAEYGDAGKASDAKARWLAEMVVDARTAADVFRPIHESTRGRDGFVSVPISPLALDAYDMIAEARLLSSHISRPNVLIQIPATRQGGAAIRLLTEAGISVHVTRIFGRQGYCYCATSYVLGLRARAARGLALDRVASVASVCLSAFDGLVDLHLKSMAESGSEKAFELMGKAAIAEARLIYARYCDLFLSRDGDSARGELGELGEQGAQPQRLMWTDLGSASSRYVDALIEPGTIAHLSLEMIDAYRRSGYPNLRSLRSTADAALTAAKLATLGVACCDVESVLEAEDASQGMASDVKELAWMDCKSTRRLRAVK